MVTAKPVVDKTVIHIEVGFSFKETVTSKEPVTEMTFVIGPALHLTI